MEDALTGAGRVWVFTDDALTVKPAESRSSRLLTALGERVVPYEAIAEVGLERGKRGSVVLRAVPRRGADPVMTVAAGQLKESADPYRLVLPADKETLADYYAQEMRAAIVSTEPVHRFMVAGPSVPRMFKAWDGAATFDGAVVTFTWFWSGASNAKQQAGDQRFSVDELEGVQWHGPKGDNGCLRLKVRGRRMPLDPAQDPASVIFGWGHWGATHRSLPFAAAVAAAIPAREPPVPELPAGRGAEVVELIEKLGGLRDAGLLTEEEFQAKKAELLSRM